MIYIPLAFLRWRDVSFTSLSAFKDKENRFTNREKSLVDFSTILIFSLLTVEI